MKTPQEIVNGLPEGNRKRACIILADGAGGWTDQFWSFMGVGQYKMAAEYILDSGQGRASAQVFADMIWEG